MKTTFKMVLCILIVGIFFSCKTTQKQNLVQNLNNAINDAAMNIVNKIPANTKVALVNTSTEYSELTNFVLQEISVVLVNKGNLEIVEREEMASIEKEHAFQMSGVVSDSEVISLVEKYGAQSVISCTITGMGSLCRLRVRTLDVRTGKVQSLNSYEIDYNSIPAITSEEKHGGLTISSTAAGKLNIKSNIKNIEINLIPMTSQYISDLPIGEYILTMIYNDGKSETSTVQILENQIMIKEFTYKIPNLWILSIGINKYNNGIASLKYPISDANGISDIFKKQESNIYNHVYNRLIADATRVNIINGFNFLDQANYDDITILYLAGHGHIDQNNNYIFIPSDAVVNNDWTIGNIITIDEIIFVLNKTKNKIIIVDTAINNKLMSELRKTGAIIYLPSVDGIAFDSEELGHGIFTYSILVGLSGDADSNNDGFVNARELGDYLINVVSILSTNKQQPLIYIPDSLEKFILSKVESNHIKTTWWNKYIK